MRGLNEEELKRVYFAEDMLKGNINRMCITDDPFEFSSAYQYAQANLNEIFNISRRRLHEREEENGTQ